MLLQTQVTKQGSICGASSPVKQKLLLVSEMVLPASAAAADENRQHTVSAMKQCRLLPTFIVLSDFINQTSLMVGTSRTDKLIC